VDLEVSLVVLAQVIRNLSSGNGQEVEEEETGLTSEFPDATRHTSQRLLGFSCS
jgi:hypothetical protein